MKFRFRSTTENDVCKENQTDDLGKHPKSTDGSSDRDSLQEVNSKLGIQLERLRNLLKVISFYLYLYCLP